MKNYPTKPPTIQKVRLDSKDKARMITEMGSSRFSASVVPFLQKCNTRIRFEYPNVATLHVITATNHIPPYALMIRALKRVVCIMRDFGLQKHLQFYLVPSPLTRCFPSPREMVQEQHINGGYTYATKDTVFIFRFEEFPKVMLHETIHHLPLDPGSAWPAHRIKEMYKQFRIDPSGCPHRCATDLMPNEAITELWADIYHCQFLSYEYGYPLRAMLRHERDWAMGQAKRVLQHQRDFFPMWKEATHAYSYIVIRAVLFDHLYDFVKLDVPYSMDRLSQFILTWSKSKRFQRAISESKIPSTDSFRMTVYGNL